MTNGHRCGSPVLLLLLQLLLLVCLTVPYTASGAYLDTIVQCDQTLPYACATRLFASTFPCPPTAPPSTNHSTTPTTNPHKQKQQPTPAPSAPCVDIEEHSVSYAFTTGLTNGTDTHGNASMGYTGFFTTLSWFGINETCVAAVNETMCASCAICNTTENLFSVDCTNLPSGVTTNCTSIAPVFYPLDASFPYPNTTTSINNPGGGGSNMTNMTTMAPSMAATSNATTMIPTSSLYPTLAPSNMTSSMIPTTSMNHSMMPTSSSMNHSMMPTSSSSSNISSTTNVPTASPIGISTLVPTKKPPSTSGAKNAALRWTTTLMVAFVPVLGTMLASSSPWSSW